MISQIAALSSNHVIGKDNTLPWHYPEDLKHFKKLTSGKTIVMGRKTYESIWRPLPNRTNLILTRNPDWNADGVIVMHDIQRLIDQHQDSKEELMVIGWEQIYKLFLPYTTTLYLTEVKRVIDWDAFYPEYKDEFVEISREKKEEYDFVEYEKREFDEID